MSLNGLDSPEVQDTYHTAIAEAGGWFLLKYTSRDSVDLLARGKHGVSEARNALAAYTEASPLYGLLMYRRRRILIKYIPAGTSRLLQARTSVHLQDVLERYSPYETLLEITNGDALNDTSLAASFHLHTSSPSPSTGRLDELREEEEDDGNSGDGGATGNAATANLSAAQRYRADRGIGKRAQRSATSLHSLQPSQPNAALSRRSTPPASPAKSPGLTLPESPAALPATPLESPLGPREVSKALEGTAEPDSTRVPDPTLHVNGLHEVGPDVNQSALQPVNEAEPKALSEEVSEATPRSSEQRTRESSPRRQSMPGHQISMRSQSLDEEPYDFSQYDALFKPKIKLGPRPINAPEKAMRSAAPRVSAVPVSLKAAPRKQELLRPKSSGQALMSRSSTAPSALESATPSLPPVPDIPAYTPRPMSRGSIRSAPSHKSGPMTPDKIRLMKAVELRKKQLRKSQNSLFNSIDEEMPEVPAVPSQPESSEENQVSSSQREEKSRSRPVPETAPDQNSTDDDSHHQSAKADSGIEMRYGTPDTQRTEETIDEVQDPPIVVGSHEDGNQALQSQDLTTILIDPSTCEEELDEEHEERQGDALSTTASQTPTERPGASDHDSDDTAQIPRILLADGTRPRGSTIESVSRNSSGSPDVPAEAAQTSSRQSSTGSGSQKSAESPHKRANSDLAKRRRGLVEPLSIETNANDVELDSDDDEFFEELHSATFQEAKPIIVARSPNAMAFQARRPSNETATSARSVQISKAATSPGSASERDARSLFVASSSLTEPAADKHDLASASRARNVSSGISKRIQALTELSGRESNGSLPASPQAPDASFGLAQRDIRKQPRRTPPATRPTSYRRQSRNSAVNTPPSATPTDESRPTWSVQHDPVTNRNSVSVTTRIARPSTATLGSVQSTAISESPPPAQVASTHPAPAIEVDPPLSPGYSTTSNDSRSLHSRSGRFRKKPQNLTPGLDSFPPPPPNTRITSNMSLAVTDENVAPKEGSKASRFFKRMSILAGPKRKNGAHSPPVNRSPVKSEANLAAPDDARRASVATAKSDTPPAAVVGDLNVQFPDSLLWKRRIVTIDDYGVLQFAIAQAMDIHRGVAMKRYSLTDFKAPFVPDLDQQELPYSVVLEFDDGTALQVACEDAMIQRQVLSLLNTYWKAYTESVGED
ncbi:Putative ADF-H/Gelsolin-like domain superfamily [Septoria linicola]|uniref:ADF-H/Gelsolin-like domain superfamily n=1 Tax=Septoria linicola TaxID=215465 RepID=A0A9Q9APA8_9PEZI|nr:putative ADF-H/Gelsolin-like domain superfamily [Septoria linicola]USW49617.1 Putative ADF-H/Gelsolin-like domain superfamily [Septoria linicola]